MSEWTIKYMRYYSPGESAYGSFRDAVDAAMWYIDDGWAAPEQIIAPDGTVAADHEWLSETYSRHWCTPSFEEHVSSRLTT